MNPPYPCGTLLLPNEYLSRDGKGTSGIVLDVKDDLWGCNYLVFLSRTSHTKWLGEDTIRDLFTPWREE